MSAFDQEERPGGVTRRAVVGGVVAGAMLGDRAGAQAAGSWKGGTWLNKPRRFDIDGDALNMTTDKGTDFWRETFYGFTRDSGHFLGMQAGDRFTAQLRIQGQYEKLYDQAGVMVRVDGKRWVKAGIELSDGRAMLSSVLTNGRSDWATGPYEANPRDFWMRATVEKGVLRLQVSADGKTWPLVRLAPFPVADHYLVGPMACTPDREGLRVRFSEWRLTLPLGKGLHDLT